MDHLILKEKQADFILNKSTFLDPLKPLFELRNKFVDKFTKKYIATMPIKEYVLGFQNDEAFCHIIEMGLNELGRIGGSPADKKFGVYYGVTKSDPEKRYRTIPKWGTTPEEAYKEIQKEIISLIEYGEQRNLSAISNSKISNMFKGKLLATYFPDKYLAVFSEKHLEHFLNLFNIKYREDLDAVMKREKLVEFKNNDSIMQKWSIFEFSKFLYVYFSPKNNDERSEEQTSELGHEESELLDEYSLIEFPDFNDVTLTFINFDQDGEVESSEKRASSARKAKKANFLKRTRRNLQKGEKGEFYVVELEKHQLREINRRDLASKVRQVSKEDDSLGYDVLSFDSNGKEKFIEVKSTSRGPGNTSFIITSNELEVSKKLPNYYIYIVYDVMSTNPKIARIGKPFERELFELEPIAFRVSAQKKKDKQD